jgi:hypothetical protein
MSRSGSRAVAIVVAGGVAVGASVSWASAGPCGTAGVYAAQGNTASCTYKAAGADTFALPPEVKAVTVTAVGGQGGTFPPPHTMFWSGGDDGVGGAGAEVTGTLSSPPSPLYVEVGADGGDSIGHADGTGGEPDGADGGLAGGSFQFLGDQGSGGGGSSDVSSTPLSAGGLTGGPGDPRLLVAGGGGGGGGGGEASGNGAAGGSAGAAAIVGAGVGGACTDVGATGGVGAGGGGGGTTACYAGGGPGSATGGGAGGINVSDPTYNNGSGGAGGGSGGGGGGGGGFIGGGGGGGAMLGPNGGGGGGAGSSYAAPAVTGVSILPASTSQAPEVVISWLAPPIPVVHVPADPVALSIAGTPAAGHELSCGAGTWTNSPTSYAYQWGLDGTPIAGATAATYLVPALDDGESLTCTVTASNGAGAGAPATSGRVLVPVPRVKRCPAATGVLSAKSIGALRLGMTRAQARHADDHSSTRGRADVDFFCFTPQGIRAGYASTKLLGLLPKRKRAKYSDRVAWISTASAHYSIGDLRHGAALSYAATQLKLSPVFVIGANDWYLAPLSAGGTGVLKVRAGVVQEIGIATTALVGTTHRAERAFLSSFS